MKMFPLVPKNLSLSIEDGGAHKNVLVRPLNNDKKPDAVDTIPEDLCYWKSMVPKYTSEIQIQLETLDFEAQ